MLNCLFDFRHLICNLSCKCIWMWSKDCQTITSRLSMLWCLRYHTQRAVLTSLFLASLLWKFHLTITYFINFLWKVAGSLIQLFSPRTFFNPFIFNVPILCPFVAFCSLYSSFSQMEGGISKYFWKCKFSGRLPISMCPVFDLVKACCFLPACCLSQRKIEMGYFLYLRYYWQKFWHLFQ